MSLSEMKWLIACAVLLAALLGGIFPLLARRTTPYPRLVEALQKRYALGEALAAGIFFGAGLLDMLPDASAAFRAAGYTYPLATLWMAVSFLVLLLIEHIGTTWKKHAHAQSSLAVLTLLMLVLHSLFEGAAVGLAPVMTEMLLLALAIVAHKTAVSFALGNALVRTQWRSLMVFGLFGVFAIASPVGIWMGNYLLMDLQQYPLLAPTANALAAGTFLYMGTLHGLERAVFIRHCCNMREFMVMLTGFSAMALVAAVLQ